MGVVLMSRLVGSREIQQGSMEDNIELIVVRKEIRWTRDYV